MAALNSLGAAELLNVVEGQENYSSDAVGIEEKKNDGGEASCTSSATTGAISFNGLPAGDFSKSTANVAASCSKAMNVNDTLDDINVLSLTTAEAFHEPDFSNSVNGTSLDADVIMEPKTQVHSDRPDYMSASIPSQSLGAIPKTSMLKSSGRLNSSDLSAYSCESIHSEVVGNISHGVRPSHGALVATLCYMFPEADPQYLSDQCEQLTDEESTNAWIISMLRNNDDPRINGGMKQRRNVSAAAGSERDLFSNLNVTDNTTYTSSIVPKSSDVAASSSGIVSSAIRSTHPNASSFAPEAPTASSTSKAPGSSASLAVPQAAESNASALSSQVPVSGIKPVVRVCCLSEMRKIMVAARKPLLALLDIENQIPPDDNPYQEDNACSLVGREDEMRQSVDDALLKKYTTEFSIPNFLEIIPDPFTYFADPNLKCSNAKQAKIFLKKKYNTIKVSDINIMFIQQHNNLTLTSRALSNWKGARLIHPREKVELDLTGTDVPFLQQMAFIENEAKILQYLKNEKREEACNDAKAECELLQCQWCYDDVGLFVDIHTCTEGHIFCVACLQKSSEHRIGDGHTSFPCPLECPGEFELQTFQEILKPTGSDDTKNMRSGLTKALGPSSTSRRRRHEFTNEERQRIVEYLVAANAYNEVRGDLVWKRMSLEIPTHTWGSLKGHFLMKILPSITKYNLSSEIVQKFKEGAAAGQRNK